MCIIVYAPGKTIVYASQTSVGIQANRPRVPGRLSASGTGPPIVQGPGGGGVNASVGPAGLWKKSLGSGVVNPPQRPDTSPFLRSASDIVLVLSFRQNFVGRFGESIYRIAGDRKSTRLNSSHGYIS